MPCSDSTIHLFGQVGGSVRSRHASVSVPGRPAMAAMGAVLLLLAELCSGSILGVGGASSAEAAPVATPWPREFAVSFTTEGRSIPGFLAYDWSRKRQAIFHGAGSTYCRQLGTDDPCVMFEIPSGTYAHIPSLQQCFLSVPGVGSLPPEWTTNSVFVGVEEVPGVGLCKAFAFPPTAHVWYETLAGSLPCLFVFPDSSMSYYFLPETFTVGPPDEKLFDFPDYCFSGGAMLIEKQVV